MKFKNTSQTFLEKVESCDTNRICETTQDMYAVNYPFKNIIAIDTMKDLIKVRNIFRKKIMKLAICSRSVSNNLQTVNYLNGYFKNITLNKSNKVLKGETKKNGLILIG